MYTGSKVIALAAIVCLLSSAPAHAKNILQVGSTPTTGTLTIYLSKIMNNQSIASVSQPLIKIDVCRRVRLGLRFLSICKPLTDLSIKGQIPNGTGVWLDPDQFNVSVPLAEIAKTLETAELGTRASLRVKLYDSWFGLGRELVSEVRIRELESSRFIDELLRTGGNELINGPDWYIFKRLKTVVTFKNIYDTEFKSSDDNKVELTVKVGLD